MNHFDSFTALVNSNVNMLLPSERLNDLEVLFITFVRSTYFLFHSLKAFIHVKSFHVTSRLFIPK